MNKKPKEGTVKSSLLSRRVPFQALLPSGYDETDGFYPVLYLLHGLFGSYKNWTELTGLEGYAADCDFIIVMPEAGDSWYTDAAGDKAEKTETFFLEEFFPAVEKQFRILREKRARAIAGLSMGGYGALKFALKRSELFSFAGSMSGAFEAPRQHDEDRGIDWKNMGSSISKVFGEKGSPTRTDNDLFRLIEKFDDAQLPSLPDFYIDCGKEDAFLKINREFAAALAGKGIGYEFREASGGHDWEYWDKQIRVILEIVSGKFLSGDNQFHS